MRRKLAGVLIIAATAMVAGALGGAGPAGGAAAVSRTASSAAAPAGTARLAAVPGSQLWVARHYPGEARSVAVSPDGTKVFVTGTGYGLERTPYVTVAYDAVTGERLWARSFGGGSYGSEATQARALAVSPDGATVFVTGSNPAYDYPRAATVAYNAMTGARRWAATYHGPFVGGAVAEGLVVSPDGAKVFLAATDITSGYGEGDTYYAAVAYSAATGKQAWARLYNGTVNGADHASAVTVSPGGSRVFVTGTSGGDYATVAYGAAAGNRLWAARYNGPANGGDAAAAIAVNPAGSKVFITGYSRGKTSKSDYATLAYSAATGTRLWAARYNGPGNGNDVAAAVAVTPGGGRTVFVTGYSYGGARSNRDYATIAYNSATGTRLWAARHNGPGNGTDAASSLAVSPGAGMVFVTGSSYGGISRADYATIAYRSATGTRLWMTRYSGPGNGDDNASAVAVSPHGAIFVTGTGPADDGNHGEEGATVAYGT